MSNKLGRKRRPEHSQVTITLRNDVIALIRDIAELSGKTISQTYDDFLVSALPALHHTKKLYEDLASLPESSRSSFIDSLNDHVANLQHAVETVRQIDIFNNTQA
jgi:uncharacterized protein (DUF1778 family)